METESEKLVKDSLFYGVHDDLIVAMQKITTPMYQKEPIDFIAFDNDGKCHLIEVKESQTSSISPNDYNEKQYNLLTQDIFNAEPYHTRAWSITRFYSGDKNRNHSQYYELYFIVPGFWVDEIKISIQNCRDRDDAILLGGYEYGDYFNISKKFGLTTRGNKTEGLKTFPFYQ